MTALPHLCLRRLFLLAGVVLLGCRVIAGLPSSPQPPVVDRDRLAKDQVLVEIVEGGLPTKEEWPSVPLPATARYTAEAFGFSQLPNRYLDTGVRADPPNPCLLRAAALVPLPAGTHRLLLRGRGAARLFVDGRLVLTTPFPPPISDGHNPI